MEGSDDKHSLRKFMEGRGYKVRAEVTDTHWASNDYIFVKKGFNEDVELSSIHTRKGKIPDVDWNKRRRAPRDYDVREKGMIELRWVQKVRT